MAASKESGPVIVYGDLDKIPSSFGSPVPSPNPDAGPSAEYQGDGIMDCRFFFPKDKVTGFTGVFAAYFNVPALCGVTQIPAALASNNIAAAQTVASGVAMTLAGASVGVSVNIPIRPFSGAINGGATATAALVLDFGFEFGNCTANSTTIPVANIADFVVGMPLVIAGVGNSGGTAPLLTNVVSIGATSIVVANAPLATNTAAAIGLGDLWGPSQNGSPTPLAHMPYIAAGPGLWLDPRQTMCRGVRVVGTSAATGGTFTVKGWDIYWQPMSETITVAAGASTGWGKKTFKAIGSVTPNFTDASHNYSVGTSDVFGTAYRMPVWDQSETFWASTFTSTATGYLAPDATSPATATTGDVRGTMQVSGNGGGTGVGSTASNGTVSSLAMSGNRYTVNLFPLVSQAVAATANNPVSLYGVTQA